MSDVKCPYCGEDQEICHDDGYGYEEGQIHQQECGDCRKTFGFRTSIHYYYEAHQAPCMNGAPHELEKSTIYPDIFKDARHCKHCEYQDREIDAAKRTAYFEKLTQPNPVTQ